MGKSSDSIRKAVASRLIGTALFTACMAMRAAPAFGQTDEPRIRELELKLEQSLRTI